MVLPDAHAVPATPVRMLGWPDPATVGRLLVQRRQHAELADRNVKRFCHETELIDRLVPAAA